MKRVMRYFILALSFGVSMSNILPPSPSYIEKFHEIATRYNENLPELFNSLTPQERIFIYYIFRASLPGNIISAQQSHRHAHEMIEVFETLLLAENILMGLDAQWLPVKERKVFFDQVKTYLVYLWANHSQYFVKEHVNEKRTPTRLGLTLIKLENVADALTTINRNDLAQKVKEIAPSIFDVSFESTSCVADSIEQSAVNFYSPDFTQSDFDSLPESERGHLNAYYFIDSADGGRKPRVQRHKIGERHSDSLVVAYDWLSKALAHVKKHPAQFDAAMASSLEHLLSYIQSGDENDFKKHSIEWIKTNSRVSYLWGSIETYKDPKESRGSFEAEVTIKAIDMDVLNALLVDCEKQLPFAEEFKRENLGAGASLPNASINAKVFGSGDAGPLQITAAYCLPNYQDIRATFGSKQIIYQASKGLGATLNPELQRKLFYLQEHADFLAHHDPQGQLHGDIWNIHCILHETLGHGSGRLAKHTFVEGDPLIIDGRQYAIGDTIDLNPDNIKLFFAGTGAALEELRAEIIALHTSIASFDLLAQAGLYKQWLEKMGKDKFIEWLIYDMMDTGLRRLQTQPIGVNEISGAHAQANAIIMNYLLDSGAVALLEEKREINGEQYAVLGFKIRDLAHAIEVITELAIQVQTLKSTADGKGFKKMLDQYGRFVRNSEHVKALQKNMQAVVGDLKVVAEIYPRLMPVKNDAGLIVDIAASWPGSFIEQQLEYRTLAHSKE